MPQLVPLQIIWLIVTTTQQMRSGKNLGHREGGGNTGVGLDLEAQFCGYLRVWGERVDNAQRSASYNMYIRYSTHDVSGKNLLHLRTHIEHLDGVGFFFTVNRATVGIEAMFPSKMADIRQFELLRKPDQPFLRDCMSKVLDMRFPFRTDEFTWLWLGSGIVILLIIGK
ncbi:hypothetical protein BDR07DRAFT_1378793 [Suillus spraguei]|nr:hypothetical protein BDR07DRAFT_1378793 [Suillus spraguei]